MRGKGPPVILRSSCGVSDGQPRASVDPPDDQPLVAKDEQIGVGMKRTDPWASNGQRPISWSRALAVTAAIVSALVLYGGLARASSTARGQLHRGGVAIGPQRARRAVSAGRDRRVVAGDVTELAGRVAAAWRGQPARWRIVAAPGDARGSEAPRLSFPAALDARFQAKVLGQYALRLTVGRGNHTVSSPVKLEAVPGTPMVPINTHAGDPNHPAITIGANLYHPLTTGMPDWGVAFVLVLKRSDLSKVDEATFSLKTWAEAVPRWIADHQLNNGHHEGDLVIVSIWPGRHDAASSNPFAFIGADLLDHSAQPNAFYSAIGVPGMHAGDADEGYLPATAPQASVGMRGYLSPDQHLDYGYIPSTEIILHYGASDRCASAPNCQTQTSGFWVRVFDPYTFRPINSRLFYTGANPAPFAQRAEADSMAEELDAIPPGDLVTVESFSSRSADGAYPRPVWDHLTRSNMEKLALAIAHVGGTRNGFNRAAGMVPAAESRGAVYTLVGWAGAGEGEGAESAAGVNGVGDTARLDLVLRPDHHSLLRPAEVTTNGEGPSALSELVLDRGKEKWPLTNDPGAMRAFAYLGSQDERLGSDPRSAYWIQNLNQSATTAIIDKLDHVAYPASSDFTKEQFETARAELIEELGWVGKVRAYLTDLSSPFSDNALSSWVTAQTVADEIYESVKPPDDETAMSWIEFVKIILHLADPVTHDISGHVADLLDFGVWAYGASTSGVPTGGEFRVKANKLGKELADRAEKAKLTYERVGDAIVSDYATLKELGTHAGCNPRDKECPPQWAFTTADQVRASVDVYRATEALAYEKLVPLAYRVYALDPPAQLFKPPIYQEQYKCGGRFGPHPFSNVPTKASATLLQVFDPSGVETNQYQLYALGKPVFLACGYVTPPPNEILDRMFDPVSDSGDPDVGGLGISQAQFLAGQEHTMYRGENTRWQP
jgi:hypothetical protein